MKKRIVLLVLALTLLVGVLPANAAEVTEPLPTGGSFSGQGTLMSGTQATTSRCWSYTLNMRTGDGLWWAKHDISWCASGGLVRSVSRSCTRYGATYPWVRDGCFRGDVINLNRNPAYVRDANWGYCAVIGAGCLFGGGFWANERLTATGGVSGSWGTYRA